VFRKILIPVGVSFLLGVTCAFAQQAMNTQSAPIPAATRSEMDCSGFIAGTPLSEDLYILDGADNDSRSEIRQFSTYEFVYLKSHSGATPGEGSEYSIVRRARSRRSGDPQPLGEMKLSEVGHISWYPGQMGSIHSLGTMYQDVGRVKVIRITPFAAIAQVTFACGPLQPGDFAVPYQQRPIPTYIPTKSFDRFAPPNGRMVGAITAGGGHAGVLGEGSIAHINLGNEDGVQAGQRFRIFHIFRENMDRGFKAAAEPPREIIGELVVLSVDARSSVAKVIRSIREISLGDGIELEEEVARAEAPPPPNNPPTIDCSAERTSAVVGGRVRITAKASDPDNDPLTFSWHTSDGRIIGSGASVTLDTSGVSPGTKTVTARVDDGRGGTADCSVDVAVQAPPQKAAAVTQLEASLELHSIYFPTAQPTALHPDGGLVESQQEILRSLAETFKKYLTFDSNARLVLEGHADERASDEYNYALTERRVARCKSFLVEQGVPASSIETQSLDEQGMLNAAQVREQMENNPELTPEQREKLLSSNLQGIVWAQNRRVDIILQPTGKQSIRRYPFNAKDALTLLNDKRLVR
jgi:outer membrane protein OmpA-like peptidoglycan-associated protein